MLESVKIARRQSEIRQSLSELVGKDDASEDEVRKIDELDREYRSNETRYRGALIAEDTERREAGDELETRTSREWAELVQAFEMRQVLLALDEGRQLEGQTNEIVTELRNAGGFRGVPIPVGALETRTTVASGTPDRIMTAPIIERLFAGSVAARMGGQMVNITAGEMEYPVATSAVSAGWAATETGNVAGPTPYETLDRPLQPNHNLGVQMRLTRKSLKQSGTALEQAVRRDMTGAIEEALDRAVFLGSGSDGEPTGILPGASAWGINEGTLDATGADEALRDLLNEVVAFITANAAQGPGDVRGMFRPEFWSYMDTFYIDPVSGLSYWDRLNGKLQTTVLSHNALAAPTEAALRSKVVMTTSTGGTPPFFVGLWGAIDMIRDPYTDAASGALKLTALTTADVTISRPAQIRIVEGVDTP